MLHLFTEFFYLFIIIEHIEVKENILLSDLKYNVVTDKFMWCLFMII